VENYRLLAMHSCGDLPALLWVKDWALPRRTGRPFGTYLPSIQE
jgi:hypothetical protein